MNYITSCNKLKRIESFARRREIVDATNFICELARKFHTAKIERARYPRNGLHPRLPRQFIPDINLWYAKQSVHAFACTGRFLDDRCRPQISAVEFLGQLLAFRKAHFGRRISDALNEHRGIMRSFAATLRAWRRCCTIFVARVRRMSIVPRIWSQFITRDYWFTIARVSGQTKRRYCSLRLHDDNFEILFKKKKRHNPLLLHELKIIIYFVYGIYQKIHVRFVY